MKWLFAFTAILSLCGCATGPRCAAHLTPINTAMPQFRLDSPQGDTVHAAAGNLRPDGRS